MKVTLVMVSSLNGKITRGDDPNVTHWTSKEDAKLFEGLIVKNNLIVMGRQTYEAARDRIKLEKGKLRIVLTHEPNKYRTHSVPGQLDFTDETPTALVRRLEAQGYKEMLLVGGSQINTSFFKEHLVNEVHLTIEPVLFGTGKPLVSEEDFQSSLSLITIQKLNAKGTLQLIYTVEK